MTICDPAHTRLALRLSCGFYLRPPPLFHSVHGQKGQSMVSVTERNSNNFTSIITDAL